MDPLRVDSLTAVVEADSLPCWEDSAKGRSDSNISQRSQDNASLSLEKAPFSIAPDINKKLVLWDGDLVTLRISAIVNVTNESLTDKSINCVKILDHAGKQLKHELKTSVKNCRTGEAKLTKGYNLPARHIIHTVGPRYNAKYRTAAESALYNSYRAVLQLMLDKDIRSVAFQPIHSMKRGYPPDEGCHLTLRCLRRFMEFHADSVDRIVILTDTPNADTYKTMASFYFPRTPAEHFVSFSTLSSIDLGGPMGEPVQVERTIRISANPLRRESSDSASSLSDCAEIDDQVPTDSSLPDRNELDHVGTHAFAKMETNPDTNRRLAARNFHPITTDHVNSERRYDRWLRKSRNANLTVLQNRRFFFHTGNDVYGRPVFLVLSALAPSVPERNYERLTLHILNLMESFIKQPYVVLFVHTDGGYGKLPHKDFVGEFRTLVSADMRWRENLTALLHLHADKRTRLFWWWFFKTTAPELQPVNRFADCLQELYHLISPEQLDLPEFVYDYDRTIAKEIAPRATTTSRPQLSQVDVSL